MLTGVVLLIFPIIGIRIPQLLYLMSICMVLLDTLPQERCHVNDEERSNAAFHISATCVRSDSFVQDTDGKHNVH